MAVVGLAVKQATTQKCIILPFFFLLNSNVDLACGRDLECALRYNAHRKKN